MYQRLTREIIINKKEHHFNLTSKLFYYQYDWNTKRFVRKPSFLSWNLGIDLFSICIFSLYMFSLYMRPFSIYVFYFVSFSVSLSSSSLLDKLILLLPLHHFAFIASAFYVLFIFSFFRFCSLTISKLLLVAFVKAGPSLWAIAFAFFMPFFIQLELYN